MTPEQEHNLVLRICHGNTEAIDWTQRMNEYAHLIDDIVDEDLAPEHRQRGVERICKAQAIALYLYTHRFFQQNQGALTQSMLAQTSDYVTSVKWEKETGWKVTCADWLRHGTIRTLEAIATACGGYLHMRAFSEELWTLAYDLHHDKEGDAH